MGRTKQTSRKEKEEKSSKKKEGPKTSTEAQRLGNSIINRISSWKKALYSKKKVKKYPEGAKIPDKSEFTKMIENVEEVMNLFISLQKYKKRNQSCYFTRELFITEVMADFLNKNVFTDSKVKIEKEKGLYIISDNLLKKAMNFYVKMEGLREENKQYKLNDALINLFLTKYPKFKNSNEIESLPEGGDEELEYRVSNKKDIILCSKDYFKVLYESFILEVEPTIVRESVKEKLREQNLFIGKLTGESKKEFVFIEPIKIRDYKNKLKAITAKIDTFREEFYCPDERGREIKQEDHYSDDAPSRQDFISLRSDINSFESGYKEKYNDVFKSKSKSHSGFSARIVKIPLNLAKLLKLESYGFPKEGENIICVSSILTSLISLYIEKNDLKFKDQKKYIKLDKALLEILKPHLSGVCKKKKYSINPEKVTITELQKPLSKLQSTYKDYPDSEKIFKLAEPIADIRKKQGTDKKDIEKLDKKLDKIAENKEIASTSYPKLKELKSWLDEEEKEIKSQIHEINNHFEKLKF